MSTPLPEISPWYDYDPVTGVGNPSTPVSATRLNVWSGEVRAVAQQAVDRSEAAAAEAEGYVTDGVDAATAANLADPDSDTRAAFDALLTGPVVDGLVSELVLDPASATGAVVVRRVDDGTTVLFDAATGIGGSPKSGNLLVGRAYQTLAPLVAGQHNDFPGLTLCADGSLLAIWRRASAHTVEIGASLVMSRSRDLGATWSAPASILADAMFDQRDPSLHRVRSGRLYLTYYKSTAATPAVQDSVIRYSDDHGQTWSGETSLPFGLTSWAAVNGITELADGTLLAFGYGPNTGDTYTQTRTIRSTDGGTTWSGVATVAVSATQNFNEVCVDTLPNGTLMALIRSDNGGGGGTNPGIYRSVSTDGGASWSAVSKVIDGWGRPEWLTLASGGLVAFYRRFGDRLPMTTTSWDNGLTWGAADVLHPEDATISQSAYMQAVQVAAGVVAVVYCDEVNSGASGVTRFRYMLDGVGFSPLGDARLSTSTANVGAWTPLTPTTGWQAYLADANYLPAYRLNGGMVEVRPGLLQNTGAVTVTAGAASALSAAIPSNLRPVNTGFRSSGAVHLTNNAPTFASFYVDSTGVLRFISSAGGSMSALAGNAYVSVPYLTWPAP